MPSDDPLQCILINVGGRLYRNQATTGLGQEQRSSQRAADSWQAPAPATNRQPVCEEATEEPTCGAEVVEDAAPLLDDALIDRQGLEYVTRVSADSELYPLLIGKGGAKKRELEAESGARLTIPRPGQPGNEVTITATTKEALSTAARAVQQLLDSALASSRLDYNFFLSLPLQDAGVRSKFEELQRQVVDDPGAAAQGIDESLCVPPEKLHLTIFMLKLYSEQRREHARQVLADLEPKVQALLGKEPLQVSLRGLEIMNEDAAKAHVLYLRVHEAGPAASSGRLLQLCQLLIDAFRSSGLLPQGEGRGLKLHATVLKTSNRRAPQEASAASSRGPPLQRTPFDARQLLAQLGDYDAGHQMLQAVHISQRSAMDETTGHYASAGHLKLLPAVETVKGSS